MTTVPWLHSNGHWCSRWFCKLQLLYKLPADDTYNQGVATCSTVLTLVFAPSMSGLLEGIVSTIINPIFLSATTQSLIKQNLWKSVNAVSHQANLWKSVAMLMISEDATIRIWDLETSLSDALRWRSYFQKSKRVPQGNDAMWHAWVETS